MAKKKLPKGGPRAAQMAASKKPSQPAQTDKFGIFLLFIVFGLLVANIVVWDMDAQDVDAAMLFKPDPAQYSVTAQVQAYQSQSAVGLDRADGGAGALTEMNGEVDVVVLNKGELDGVRMGDIFRPETVNDPNGNAITEADARVEFAVFETSPTQSRAFIILGRTPEARSRISLDYNSMRASIPLGSAAKRERSYQTVRNSLQQPAQ